jgi:hypothetical protein
MFFSGRTRHLILGGLFIAAVLMAEREARSQERLEAQETTEEKPLSMLERSQRLVANIQKLGPWEEQAGLIQQAGDNLFQTYGWDSEADEFAQNMLRDITSIPPWDFSARFELVTQMISDRYDFTPEQLAQVQQKVMMQMFQFFGRHSSKIFQLSEEMISARAEGRPFSPEEVARWSRLAEPMMQEGLDVYERMCREVEPLLNERQREIMNRDRAGELRRARSMMARMEDWKQGRWKPEDWGLQDDPLHAGGKLPPGMQARYEARAEVSADPEFDPTDESAWARYVRWFITRYGLDTEQVTAAEAILQDVRTQARVFRSAGEAEASSSTSDDRMGRVLTQLFEQLKRRLNLIATLKQRQAVESGSRFSPELDRVPPGDSPDSAESQ